MVILLCLRPAIGGEGSSVRLRGLTMETGKHILTLGPTGLPQQITIKADSTELPLELRRGGVEVPQSALQGLGRGDQLREAMRIIVVAQGNQVVAEPASPAKPVLAADCVKASTELKAGDVSLKLGVVYSGSGRMDFTVTYGGRRKRIEELALIVDIAGLVDTVVPGRPVADTVRAYNPVEFALGTEEGIAWANTGESVLRGGRDLPGGVPRAYVGSGDRGFTWLCEDTKAGLVIDDKAPSMLLIRDKSGLVSWRLRLVNHDTVLGKQQTAKFSILMHPARAKSPDARRTVWTQPLENLPRSDQTLDAGPKVGTVSLEGPAGGDALSAKQHLAATYPIKLHRYLAATHTGLSACLHTNASRLVRAGQSLAADRMALGRALLHDIGVDAAGLAHLAEAATVVKALDAFGCFRGDGNTEFIPYWRTSHIVRYGEVFVAEDAFTLDQQDPLAQVHLSLWRRPHRRRTKALIVVVNESPKPVREQLYIVAPAKLFGGPNQVRARDIIAGWDLSAIPENSDWSKRRLQAQVLSHAGSHGSDVSLLDMTDRGFVRLAKADRDKGIEVYGPLHIPPHSYRILYGAGQ